MENIFGFTKEDLSDYFESKGLKKFMAHQVYDWLYDKNVYDPDLFLNVKKENREFLKENFSFDFIKIEKVEEDKDVKKFLFRLLDGNKIEAVLMMHNYGKSICISSQVGCNMGCKFCESGRLKKVRDLNVYEMVEQIILVKDYINSRIDSIVIMGIGEPFDNYDNVMKFLSIANDPKALNIGSRHITVSTSGIIPRIYDFAGNGKEFNLAISLHAPSDEIRRQIMPVANAYSIENLITAIKDYIEKTGRRVTIEYVMLKNINDSVKCAQLLADLLCGMNIYVNLIPYNETNNIIFKASDKEVIDKFYDVLKQNNIDVTVRRKFGDKISAACGQLRSKEE